MSLILDGTNGLSDVDGTAAAPAIRGTDANTGIFFPAADTIGFSEGGAEVARFNADAQFVAAAGTAALPVITTTGDVNTGIFFPAADTIAFAEGGAEAMRIDSSGNLGLGVTPSASDGTLKYLQVSGTAIFSGQVGTEAMRLGSNWYYNGGFKYQGTGTATTYDQSAGTHIWKTAASGTAGAAITFTESMRIDSSGNLLVGATSYSGGVPNDSAIVIRQDGYMVTRVSGNGNYAAEFQNVSGTGVGNITVNSGSTQYITSSDYRLKEDIAPMTGALATVAALKPVSYKWKATGEATQGFIAHELQAVVPECVVGEKDAVDADGNPVHQGIDTSFLVATLTAAIQELHALVKTQDSTITALTTRITALEAA